MEAIILPNKSNAFSNVIYCKSQAEITANNDNPILVEEVLGTIFSFRSSW